MNKQESLDKLKKEMSKDKSLPLRDGATNLVFGEGNPNADLVFIGEGPGYWEDIKARPFVGNAGSLLNQLLHSIELSRSEVFITNVVCYRPPGNRDPLPEEIAAFQKYLDRIIEIIEPEIIVTLGRFSMAKFLPGVKISSVHGKHYDVDWKGKRLVVVPMYHPAAALRRSEILQQEKDDFLKLKEYIEKMPKNQSKQMELIL